MIDYTEVRSAIEELLENNFIEVPIQMENKVLKDPKEYIAVTTKTVSSEQIAIGSESRQITELLILQIFTGYGTGTDRAREIGSLLANLLSGVTAPGITFETSELNSVGKVKDVDYFLHTLTTPFSYTLEVSSANGC